MHKSIPIFFSFFFLSFFFVGCQECIECSFTIPMLGDIETSGEQCGTGSEIDDVQDEWEQLAADAGTTVNCVRN